MIENFLPWLVWDPDKNILIVPYLNHPITWYGLLFAFGFLVGYFFIRRILEVHFSANPPESASTPDAIKLLSISLADRLAVLVIFGTLVGARLGDVIFYGWSSYSRRPLDIFKIWEGGLASHGGAVGIILALFLFSWWHRRHYPSLTFLAVLDMIVIPAAFAGGCIRIGNFINQEILGIPTSQPWGVIFLHPFDGVSGMPRHPVQLYEALAYFCIFILLVSIWRKQGKQIGKGLLSGLFFLLVFGVRFLIEFLKSPESDILRSDAMLNMGQVLSIPFIVLGILLLLFYKKKSHAPS